MAGMFAIVEIATGIAPIGGLGAALKVTRRVRATSFIAAYNLRPGSKKTCPIVDLKRYICRAHCNLQNCTSCGKF